MQAGCPPKMHAGKNYISVIELNCFPSAESDNFQKGGRGVTFNPKKSIADFTFTKYKVENKENCEEIEDTECQLVPGQVGTDYQRRERDIHTI